MQFLTPIVFPMRILTVGEDSVHPVVSIIFPVGNNPEGSDVSSVITVTCFTVEHPNDNPKIHIESIAIPTRFIFCFMVYLRRIPLFYLK